VIRAIPADEGEMLEWERMVERLEGGRAGQATMGFLEGKDVKVFQGEEVIGSGKGG
jgi:hypothetical protein